VEFRQAVTELQTKNRVPYLYRPTAKMSSHCLPENGLSMVAALHAPQHAPRGNSNERTKRDAAAASFSLANTPFLPTRSPETRICICVSARGLFARVLFNSLQTLVGKKLRRRCTVVSDSFTGMEILHFAFSGVIN